MVAMRQQTETEKLRVVDQNLLAAEVRRADRGSSSNSWIAGELRRDQ